MQDRPRPRGPDLIQVGGNGPDGTPCRWIPVPPEEAPSGRKGYWKCSQKGFTIPGYAPGDGTNDVILIVRLPHEPVKHTGVHRTFTTRGQWDEIVHGGDLAARKDHFFQWYGLAFDDDDIEDWEWLVREFLPDEEEEK